MEDKNAEEKMEKHIEDFIECKMNFSRTLIELDPGMPKVTDECFLYGIMSGCDELCPKWRRGECEIQEENRIYFIKEGLIDE